MAQRSAPAQGWRWERWGIHLGALLAYALLTGVMTWPLAQHLTTAIPGDSFDGWQNYWNLWWVKLALVDGLTSPLFTDLLYHPTGVGLYFHTLNPFNGLATLPIQLSAGLIPAYNGVVLISWVLGGYGAFLLALYVLTRHTPRNTQHATLPAFVAGLIFTFSPFHMAHLLGHMQVMSLEWIPFYILALMQATDRASAGRPWLAQALLAGLFLTLVGLCDWYFVLYLFLFTGLYLGFSIFDFRFWIPSLGQERLNANPKSKILNLQSLLPPLVAGTLFLLLLSPMLIPMVREASQFNFMVRPPADLYILSASLMDFLVPNRLHPLGRPESFAWVGNQIAPVSERTISIGYITLILAGVAGWKAGRQAAFWLVSGGFFLLLALGPAIHVGNITWAQIPVGEPPASWTPYGLLNELIPFMRISRSVSRFAVMVQLSLAVAAAVGLAWAVRRGGRAGGWPYRILPAMVIIGILAEFWVAPYPISPPDTPEFYSQLAQAPGSQAVLNLPMNYDRPGYLLYQTVHAKPLTVAYISRDDPRTLTERMPVLQQWRHLGPDILTTEAERLGTVGRTVLADLDVGWVVLDRYKMPGGLEQEYTEALAAALFAGIEPIYADERITVYGVPPVDLPQPYLALGPLHWGPLTETDGRSPFRTLLDGPAQVTLHHLPPGAGVEIRYRSAAAGAAILAQGGAGVEPMGRLLAAAQGNVLTLSLPPESQALIFQPQGAGVEIESIRLILPPPD